MIKVKSPNRKWENPVRCRAGYVWGILLDAEEPRRRSDECTVRPSLRRRDCNARSERHKTDTKIHHVGMRGAGFQQSPECLEEVIGVMSGKAG